ncbi:MAG: hypothetical protein DMG07_26160 [Acidobacteria bacterium]|nr:MAG: hypothetical protein DMG07_26160 [Acidobacteriota bacterium]
MLKGLPTVGGDFNNFLASAAFSAAIFLGSDGFDGVKTPNYSFNLNGADVSSAQANNAYIWIPVEALDEVTVSYNSGSAEAGFGAAQISGVTKRGTNSLHGSLYEYYASNLWSTRPEFAVGVFHPSRYDRNEFGFTIGGPVILPKYNGRNKTFFFLAWDDYISRGTQGLATGSSPTAKMRTGDFSEVPFSLRDPLSGDTIATQVTFPNNVIPASRIAPVALKQWATKLGDLPNLPTLVNNLVIPVLSTNNRDGHQLWAARVDQNLGSRDVLTVDFNGLFSYIEQYQDRAGAQTHNIRRNLPQSPNYNVGGQWVHTFTPRMFSETTFNRRYFAFRQLVFPNGDPLWYKTNGVAPPPGLVEDESKAFTLYGPLFTFSGNGATDRFGPFAETPVVRDDAGIFFAERFSYVRGRHTLKFGAEYKLERMTPDFTGNWRGTFNYVGANTPLSTGWAAADFLLGLPNSVSYRGVQSTVQPRVTRPRYASYVQEEWKVAPKLTVNLGLRWEYLAPLTEDNNMLAQFDLTSKQIVVAGNSVPSNLGTSFAGIPLVAASSVGLGGNLWRTPRANFTPRFSVAFRPFGGTRTVVRAGYGMYYQDEGLGNQYGAAQSAPFVYSITAITQPGAGRITWSNPFPAASVQKQGFSTRPRDWPVERFQQWNFTIEREVGWNSAVSLAYLGSRVGLGSVGIDSNYPTVAGINPDGTQPCDASGPAQAVCAGPVLRWRVPVDEGHRQQLAKLLYRPGELSAARDREERRHAQVHLCRSLLVGSSGGPPAIVLRRHEPGVRCRSGRMDTGGDLHSANRVLLQSHFQQRLCRLWSAGKPAQLRARRALGPECSGRLLVQSGGIRGAAAALGRSGGARQRRAEHHPRSGTGQSYPDHFQILHDL